MTSGWRLVIPRLIACQLDVVLSLVNKEGNPSPARLYIRITRESISAVAGDALEQAQTFAQKLSQPLISNASDAFTNISDTLSHQQKLITSFDALLMQFKPLVKIGDEIAKVCSAVLSPVTIRINSFFSKDPSLCQFCVDSPFCRNEGKLNLIIDPLLHIIHFIRLCKPNKLGTRRF